MKSDASGLYDFSGKVVLITGAASGIGRAVTVAFAAHGAKVSIGDLNEVGAAETLELVTSAGGEGIFRRADAASEDDVERLVIDTVQHFGRLDCAFNNAGISPSSRKPVAELDTRDFDRLISVDLRSVFLCMKAELRQMARAGHGAIVNTASVAGVVAEPGAAGYVAAKHGVIGLTKAAAVEYASLGIRVNAIAPGWVDTPMTSVVKESALNEQLRTVVPLGRPAKPEEMAGAVLYLCSDAASYISGQVHLADGAFTARGMFPTEMATRSGAK